MRQPVPFGKYLLLDRISVGGMAEVFRAMSYGVEGFEKVIAIKRILPAMGEDKDFIKMFIDEAKIAGQLSHANICHIFELGRIKGSHFIAMEYIWGKDLLQIQNRLRKVGQVMPVAMACYIISKVCEGLDHAHRKKDAMGRPLEIIHRDCSPQNVLVSYEGEVKLIDFGIARAASRSSRTNAGVLKGKFGYMSPEQVRGLPLDHRSDLFAVGTCFYESLTGERLFLGESDFSTLEKVRNTDVRPPSQLNQNIPPEVEAIVMRALARDPKARFESGAEMHAALQAFLTRQAVPLTNKTLADWLKDTFRDDLEREKQQMEEYKRIRRDGFAAGESPDQAQVNIPEDLGQAPVLEGEPTMLDAPHFTDMTQDELDTWLSAFPDGGSPQPRSQRGGDSQGAHAAGGARGKVLRLGSERDEWEQEEGPTEVFGEIGVPSESALPERGRVAPAAAAPAPAVAAAPAPAQAPARWLESRPSATLAGPDPRGGRQPGPGHARPSVSPPPIPRNGPALRPYPSYQDEMVGRPQVVPPASPWPPASPPPTFYPAPQPDQSFYPDPAGHAPGYSYPPPFEQPHGLVPPTPGALWRRPTTGRDVAIGCAIAALVLSAFVSIKFLVFGDEPRAEAEGAATGTILVVVRDAQPAEVLVDEKSAGTIRDQAPLMLSAVPAGPHTVQVARAGAPPCQRTVQLGSRKVEVVECSFPKAPTHGRLILVGVEPKYRVFVDDQEVSVEAAREPLNLTPGVEHTIQIKSGMEAPETVEEFTVELEPGQEMRRELKPSTSAGRARARDAKRRSGPSSARSGADRSSSNLSDSDLDLDPDSDLDSRSSPGRGSRSSTGSQSGPNTGAASGPGVGPGTGWRSAASATSAASPVPWSAATSPAGAAATGGSTWNSGSQLGSAAETGSLTASTEPIARVFIDGHDTGKMTPVPPQSAIPLSVGNHTIAFVVGDQTFSYRIKVTAGQRINLVKTLRLP